MTALENKLRQVEPLRGRFEEEIRLLSKERNDERDKAETVDRQRGQIVDELDSVRREVKAQTETIMALTRDKEDLVRTNAELEVTQEIMEQ